MATTRANLEIHFYSEDSASVLLENSATEENEGNYYRQERRSGAFQRVITLPVRVEADKTEATFEDGVLKLELPKVAEVKATTIEVKPKAAASKSS